MSITLSAPPAVVQDVRMYAERNSTSLNAIIREHLEKIAAIERKSRRDGADQLKRSLSQSRIGSMMTSNLTAKSPTKGRAWFSSTRMSGFMRLVRKTMQRRTLQSS